MDSLQILIPLAQTGDFDAFGQLVHRYQDAAVGYAYTIVGERCLAEDAAQEAFIEAYRCLPTLREPIAFGSWFRRIIFKQCDRLTRGKRVPTVALEAASDVPTERASLPEIIEQREVCNQVLEAVQSLPEEQRKVTMLFYLGEYSQKEVAAFLELSPTKVNNCLRSARKRLRERMIDMTQNTLQDERPSKDDKFKQQVMAMIKAAADGDAAKVGSLLDGNPSLIAATGQIPLIAQRDVQAIHAATYQGHQDVMAELLARGADVNAVDDRKRTPLHIAVANKRTDLADYLIKQGATIDIFAAARMGDVERVKTLLQSNPSLANARGPDGASPLHYVAKAEVVQVLVDANADPNARDDHGLTPLVWHGADMEIAKALVDNGAVVEDIFLAAAIGDIDQARQLLNEDATQVNRTKEVHGNQLPPLAAAVFNQQPEMVQLLLEHGASPNVTLFDGAMTLLHEAAKSGNFQIVKLLVDHGADLNAKDGVEGKTPLEWAPVNDVEIKEVLQQASH